MNAFIQTRAATEQPYRFKMGQAVDHSLGGMPAKICGRQRTAVGREIYDITLVNDSDRPHRTVLGSYLVAA